MNRYEREYRSDYHRKCLVCSKSFLTHHKAVVACSFECKEVWRRERMRIYARKRYLERRLLEKQCKVCNKLFETTSKIKLTCSNRCGDLNKREYQRTRYEKTRDARNRGVSLPRGQRP